MADIEKDQRFELLLECRELLSALWDCTCGEESCERCLFLARIDARLKQNV